MRRFAIALLASLLVSVGLAHAQGILVVNEVDYDQVGVDNAEFIEIKNTTAAPINLGLYQVVLVNGATGLSYKTINLPAVNLAAGDYYVICGQTSNTPGCDLDELPDTDMVQNGAPDGVLIQTVAQPATIIDAVSYEGNTAGCTEGTGSTAADSNTIPFISLSRFPDGGDTNDNQTDFSLRCMTPGFANTSGTTGCTAVAVTPTVWGGLKSIYR